MSSFPTLCLSHSSIPYCKANGYIWLASSFSVSFSCATAVKVSSRSVSSQVEGHGPVSPLKKVLVPIGFGTEEMEAVLIVDVLRRAGADVFVASVESEVEVEASCGTKFVADSSISACCNEAFDLIAFPGGMPGAAQLRDSHVLRQIATKHVEENKLYAAICAAPAVTLLPWDLLKRRQMTGHPAFMDKLPSFWAVKSNVHVSGKLTTSQGPGTCLEFSLSLAEQLFGESTAEYLRKFLLLDSNDSSKKVEFNQVQWPINGAPRILVPIANGSEGIEVASLVDILRRAKMDVVVASVEDSLPIQTSQNLKIVADKHISHAAESTYDAIILPGGDNGMEKIAKCETLCNLLKDQKVKDKIYGGSNFSPVLLHNQSLLADKQITAHPSAAGSLTGVVDDAAVVIDGKIITGKGLSTMTEFCLAIVSKFFGDARAASVAEGLVFDYRQR